MSMRIYSTQCTLHWDVATQQFQDIKLLSYCEKAILKQLAPSSTGKLQTADALLEVHKETIEDHLHVIQ